MFVRVRARPAVVLLLGVLLGGCALFTLERRTTEGPTAEEIWTARFRGSNNRSPGFEERQSFQDQLDARVREYLARNFQAASSLRVGHLRFWRQVSLGMTKEEVTLLLGAPQEVTGVPARMEGLAGKFWPEVKGRAKEAWMYPVGWTLYFDGDALADITQHHRAFLRP